MENTSMLLEKATACFLGSTKDATLDKLLNRTDDFLDYDPIREVLISEMMSDCDARDASLLDMYKMATPQERAIMDLLLVELCGWTLESLMQKALEHEEEIDDDEENEEDEDNE